jgi:hypothetical protein
VSALKFVTQPFHCIIKDFISKHRLLQALQKATLKLIATNQQVILANRNAALMVHGTAVAFCPVSAAAGHQCDTAAALSTLQEAREKINMPLLPNRQAIARAFSLPQAAH